MEFLKLSKEIEEIDKKIFDLNKAYSLATNSLGKIPNTFAYEEFSKKAKEILDSLEKVKSKTEFEKIFIENSTLNINLQIEYLEYFTYGKKNNLESFSKKELGEDFFKILKDKIDSFDYRRYWDYFLSYQEYLFRSIPSSEESFRPKFEEILVDLKKDILDYAKENLGLEKDYDFDLVLGPSFENRTNFHPTNRRMTLSPYSFFIYKDGSEIKINVAAVISSIFHEIVGHGKHESNSCKMPLSLQDNSIITSLAHLHIHFEAVSQFAENESIAFMEKYKEKYNIEEDYIIQEKHQLRNRGTSSFYSLYSYFKLKKLEDDSFDVNFEYEKIVKNHGLTINQSLYDRNPISFFKDSCYIMGLEYLESLLEELKKEIGEENYEENFKIIDEAISTGVFHFKVWPKFVRFFLKQKGVLV